MKDNVVYQILLQEANRISSLKKDKFDLYTKDAKGNFVKIAEAFDPKIEELKSLILKKRKTRFYISFVECMDMMDDLPPSAHRVLRFLVQQMNNSNVIDSFSYREINECTGIHLKYIQKGIHVLLEKDIIRWKKNRNGKSYMVNPIFYFKGKLNYIFKCVSDYEGFKDLELPKASESTTNVEADFDNFLKKPKKNIFE